MISSILSTCPGLNVWHTYVSHDFSTARSPGGAASDNTGGDTAGTPTADEHPAFNEIEREEEEQLSYAGKAVG